MAGAVEIRRPLFLFDILCHDAGRVGMAAFR